MTGKDKIATTYPLQKTQAAGGLPAKPAAFTLTEGLPTKRFGFTLAEGY